MKSKFLLTGFLLLAAVSSVWSQSDAECPFAGRRTRIMNKLDGGIALMKSAERQGDTFRQNPDFFYLTGFKYPESAFILDPAGEKKYILFVAKSSVMAEVWTGKQPGPEEARQTYGADTAYVFDDFDDQLKSYLKGKSAVYLDFSDEELMENIVGISGSKRGSYPTEIKKLNPLIHEMRVIKDEYEIADLRKAIDITCEAQMELMRSTKPGMYEYQGNAIINYVYQSADSKRPGFPSIVGSGPNATVMHYMYYSRQMEPGDLLLVDIGSEWNMYSADVTRTFPVSGKFSEKQKTIYNIVLQAELEAIKTAKPGVGYKTVMDAAETVIKEGSYGLGLIVDKEAHWQYSLWTLHGFGHWLGLDTHDVGDYEKTEDNWILLRPGMVFTIEPGIYFHEKALTHLIRMMAGRAPEEEVRNFVETVTPLFEAYKNIGVRIEDDLLITDKGCTVLSEKAPKTIPEIERLMKRKSQVFK